MIRMLTSALGTKGLVLLGSLLLTVAVTGGVFAYAYTTASINLGTLTAVQADFANVTAGSEFDWWHSSDDLSGGLLGRVSGGMSTANNTLFTINPHANYNGDLEIKVYLANAGHMRKAFKHFNMMLLCGNSSENASANLTWQLLTLENAEVLWHLETPGGTGSEITLVGGSWHTIAYEPLPWAGGDSSAYNVYPKLYCEVQPR